MLVDMLGDAAFCADPAGAELIQQLATTIGARNRPVQVNRVLQALATHPTVSGRADLQRHVVRALGAGLRRTGARLDVGSEIPAEAMVLLKSLLAQARQTAVNAAAAQEDREMAIDVLNCTSFTAVHDTLSSLIDIRQPEPIQLAAISAISAYPNEKVGAILLRGWREHSPAVRKVVIDALLARRHRTIQLLRAAERGDASIVQVAPSRRTLLLQHDDEVIRGLARKLFVDDAPVPRGGVLENYEVSLQLESDSTRGEKIFRRDCMACHEIGDAGHPVGPDLTSTASQDAEALLVHVLDPNRYVPPKYQQYVVVDTSGRTFTGIISAQTATSLTIQREEGKSDTILRADVDEVSSTGKSLMPEGLEKKIHPQEMADLIDYLRSVRNPHPTGEPPLHIGTLPGLIEPDE